MCAGRWRTPSGKYLVTIQFSQCNVCRGYKEVNRNLTDARRTVEWEDRKRISASIERTPPATYYKSVVGTR